MMYPTIERTRYLDIMSSSRDVPRVTRVLHDCSDGLAFARQDLQLDLEY